MSDYVDIPDFASSFKRNSQGWLIFPNDVPLRRSLYPDGVFGHPAKMNLFIIQELVSWLTQPGDIIMDIMGGTGSMMMAATMGRNVVITEIEPYFYGLILEGFELFTQRDPTFPQCCTVLHGDCRKFLPLPVNHIIFSPPYSNVLTFEAKAESTKALSGGARRAEEMLNYHAAQTNVGNYNRFIYQMEMEKIYKLCYNSILPGGTLTVMLMDVMVDGKRYGLSKWMHRVCLRHGFQELFWFKRYNPGTGQKKSMRAKGMDVIDDEDIVTFRKV